MSVVSAWMQAARAGALVRARTVAAALAAATLAACASLEIDGNRQATQDFARDRLGAELRLLATPEEQAQARSDVESLLARPLTADDAVRIALAFSPALQAMLFESAAASAAATRSARLPNPILSLERLARREAGTRELELGQAIGISLVDLLLLPLRRDLAAVRQAELRLNDAASVVQAATRARQAWVQAVAARQSAAYFADVRQVAEVGAELARRMQGAGNFSRLQRAREQAFYAQAAAQQVRAQHAERSAREALARALGLDAGLAQRLRLPERLPDLPGTVFSESAVSEGFASRLDVRLVAAQLEYQARSLGLSGVASVFDGTHLVAIRSSETGEPAWRGWEVELPLPLFDPGDATRAGAEARWRAAQLRSAQVMTEAASQLREAYGAYRSAHDLARHYRDEVVPLRKAIAEEMVLKYNGMLIGVFDLLADAREQIGSVLQAIDAQRDFWLADAALRAAMIGRPVDALSIGVADAAPVAGGGAGH